MKELSIEYLSECFEVDFEKYILNWKKRPSYHFKTSQSYARWNTLYSGKVAGSINAGGYFVVKIDASRFLVHRLIWAIIYGKFSQFELDHIDGNRQNNNVENLRECSEGFHNQRNRKRNSNNTSGQMGVLWRKDREKWVAVYYVSRGNRTVAKKLGSFQKFEDAVSCRLKWEEDNNFSHRHEMP